MNNPRIQWLVDRVLGKTLLDVGCNKGWFSALQQFGVYIVGIDINRWKNGYDYFIQADAHHLPFKTSSFDTVIVAEVLEHAGDPSLVLQEAGRVAKERVLFTTPNEYEWSKEHRPFMSVEEAAMIEGKTPLEYFHQGTISDPDCLFGFEEEEFLYHRHIRYYDRETITKDVELSGLLGDVEELKYAGLAYWVGVLHKP